MREIAQSNSVTILVGPFSTSSATAVTSLSLAASDDAELVKHESGSVVDISARTFTHIQGGYFNLTLTNSDTSTLGMARLFFRDENLYLPFFEDVMVVNSNYYNSKYGSDRFLVDLATDQSTVTVGTVNAVQSITNIVEANVTQLNGGSQSLLDLKDFADSGYNPSSAMVLNVLNNHLTYVNSDMRGTNNALLASSAPSNWSQLDLTSSGQVTVSTNNDKTGYSLSADQSGVTIGTVNAVQSVTNIVEANMTQIAGITQDASDLGDFAANGYDPTSNTVLFVDQVNTTVSNTDMRGTDNAFLAASAPTNFSVFDLTSSGQVTVSTNNDKTGYDLNSDQSAVTIGIVNSVGVITTVSDKTGYSLASDQSAVTIGVVNSVTNIVAANVTQLNGGSQSLLDLKDFSDNGYNPASSMVLRVLNNYVTFVNSDMRGTDSALLAANVPTNFTSLAITAGGAITVGTNNDKSGYSLSSDQSAVTIGIVNSVGMVSSIYDKSGYSLAIDQSTITIGTVNNLGTNAKTAVNSEMVDVLFVDTISELSQGAPAITPTIASGLMLLYMISRNKEVADSVNGLREVYNNAGTRIAKATLTDTGSVFTKATFISGA